MKAGIITLGRRVLDITEEEIDTLVDELSKMYPEGYPDLYAGIYAMQGQMKIL